MFLKNLLNLESEEGVLEPREIAQIALRVADKALESLDDKKMTPAEIYDLLVLAYQEYQKEVSD